MIYYTVRSFSRLIGAWCVFGAQSIVSKRQLTSRFVGDTMSACAACDEYNRLEQRKCDVRVCWMNGVDCIIALNEWLLCKCCCAALALLLCRLQSVNGTDVGTRPNWLWLWMTAILQPKSTTRKHDVVCWCFTALQQLRSLAPGCGGTIIRRRQFKVMNMMR